MSHRITITADRHDEPDLDRIVACLLALSLARLEEEEEANQSAETDGAVDG